MTRNAFFCISFGLTFIFSCKHKEIHSDIFKTNIQFESSDSILKELFDQAERKAIWNITSFDKYDVLIEGARYRNLWLETQPMGGYMYAKRNLIVAKNNIKIFMDYQRSDGRLPGMIKFENNKIEPKYGWFQGLYFPMPAYELYFLLGKDKNYLKEVYDCLEDFDNYLWKTRDSDNDGCLETWCIWDTGEDECIRFNGFPNAWPFDYPPSKENVLKMFPSEIWEYCKEKSFDSTKQLIVPIESMDIMSYSYSCRDVLSLISAELKNGKEEYWLEKANDVQTKIKDYLWDTSKKACFDKNNNNDIMPVLLINNLKCMYFGSFDQEMADEFIKNHLLNPEEFWTPMPLPSIAANSPYFRNISGNNWSGQPQGLTFQRSIRALENYGHYAELTMIGKIFLGVIADSMKFTQQFYPFKKVVNNSKDGYGPSILTTLELISRFYGTHITCDKIYWSSIDNLHDYRYEQTWNNNLFQIITQNNDKAFCYINGENIAVFTPGIRLVTDIKGKLIEIVGITEHPINAEVEYNGELYSLIVEPNITYRLSKDSKFTKYKSIEFSYKNYKDK